MYLTLINKKFLKSSLLVLLLILPLSACIPRLDPRWLQTSTALEVSNEQKLKICYLLKQRSAELKSVRFLSSLSIDEGEQNLRLSLVFKAPSLSRFEVLPPQAALALFIATSNGDSSLLLEPTKRKATKVKSAEALLYKLIKANILPEDLAYILSSRVPPKDIDRICASPQQPNEINPIKFLKSEDFFQIVIFDQEGGQYWSMNSSNGLVRTAMLRRASDSWPVLTADFAEDDFADPNNLFPSKAHLVLGNEDLFAKLEYSIVKLNTVVPDTLFEAKVPSAYTIEEMQ